MSDKQKATMPSKFGYAQVKLGTSGAAAVYGTESVPVADPSLRPGWYYEKPKTEPATVGKVNLFFGLPITETLTVQEYSCMWAILSIDHYAGTSEGLPWMTMYTKYDASRADNASWYRSKEDYPIPFQRELIRPGERVCIFTGNHIPPVEQLNGARMIHLGSSKTGPPILGTDAIQFFALQTNSTSVQSAFCVESMGYMTHSDQPNVTQYNLNLVA